MLPPFRLVKGKIIDDGSVTAAQALYFSVYTLRFNDVCFTTGPIYPHTPSKMNKLSKKLKQDVYISDD